MDKAVFINKGDTRYHFHFRYPMLKLDLKRSQYLVKLGSEYLWDTRDPSESPLSLKRNIGETCWSAYILDDNGRLIGSSVGEMDLKKSSAELNWLIIHPQWRGESLRSKGESSLCYPFFRFLLIQLSRHCGSVSLFNVVERVGCYCYVKAGIDLNFSVYLEGVRLSSLEDCLETPDLENILIKFHV